MFSCILSFDDMPFVLLSYKLRFGTQVPVVLTKQFAPCKCRNWGTTLNTLVYAHYIYNSWSGLALEHIYNENTQPPVDFESGTKYQAYFLPTNLDLRCFKNRIDLWKKAMCMVQYG